MADRQDTIAGWKGPIYLSTVFHLCRPLQAFAPFSCTLGFKSLSQAVNKF